MTSKTKKVSLSVSTRLWTVCKVFVQIRREEQGHHLIVLSSVFLSSTMFNDNAHSSIYDLMISGRDRRRRELREGDGSEGRWQERDEERLRQRGSVSIRREDGDTRTKAKWIPVCFQNVSFHLKSISFKCPWMESLEIRFTFDVFSIELNIFFWE